MGIRLNKYLASVGIASRRKVDELIEAGKVRVNSQKAQLGQQVEPERDEIVVSGRKIGKRENLVYIILNKPKGVTSTVSDEHAQKTVLDLVKVKERVFPVGRLDVLSEGLILLTNDGELAQKLTHPKFHVAKRYEVLISGSVSAGKLEKLRGGVVLDDGVTAPADVKVLHKSHNTLLEMVLYEGKKREIRRMTAAIFLHLLNLKRVAIGTVELEDLKSGEWRKLSPSEVEKLKAETIN